MRFSCRRSPLDPFHLIITCGKNGTQTEYFISHFKDASGFEQFVPNDLFTSHTLVWSHVRQFLSSISTEASFNLSKLSSTDANDLPIIFSSAYQDICLDLFNVVDLASKVFYYIHLL